MVRTAILTGLFVLGALTLGRLVDLPATVLAKGEATAAGEEAASATAADAQADAPSADATPAPTEERRNPLVPVGPTPGRPADPTATYAGDEACAVCHEEIAAAEARSPHGAAPDAAWKGRTCEGCHGPGQAHVDATGEAGTIRSLKDDMAATERAGACLSCHANDPHLRDARRSEHLQVGVACSGCHDPHGQGTGRPLLRRPETDLCMSCHLDVRAAFAMPYRHGITQGRVDCGDCHDPHGGRNPGLMKAPNDRTCFTCHADMQGPWVFEHATVVTEGCNSCHVPHGSSNRHLLQNQQVAQLCYRCHTLTPSNHVQPSFRDCTRCHVWIHGSNTDPRFLEP